MKIGIDASFLRKPGTGIGQVTVCFLEKLAGFSVQGGVGKSWQFLSGLHDAEIILYTEEPIDAHLAESFTVRSFLPAWWKRDDVIRKMLWERQVAREAAKDGCDAFISLYQSATVFHGARSMEHGAREPQHLMVVHDIIPKLFPEYLRKVSQRIHWRAIERGIRGAGHIVAISESTKKDLMENLGIAEEKISVAHPGLSPAFDHVADDANVDLVMQKYHLDRGYIYHGGGLEVRKNTRAVLEAYGSLCDKFPISNFQFPNKSENLNFKIPKLVISGRIHAKSNPLALDAKGLIKELRLEENVKLLGFVPDEDLPALYRGAALFAYPSLYEGFGLPPLEAMSQGTPCIVSDVSSLPEACGDAALYVDPTNADLIAEKMSLLLRDAELRKELCEKGMLQAKKFGWAGFVKAVMQ